MSGLLPLVLALLLLALPWALRKRPLTRPEIHGHLRPLWWLNAFYCAVVYRLEHEGLAPLPEHGPALLISNHTCGIDHMILQAGCRRVLGFMIAQEFYDYWACNRFCRMINCIPVRRDGQDLAAIRTAIRALNQGRVVPIFPEGKIHPTSGRELGEGRPGAAFIALHARVPVIPAYISGTPPTADVFRALIIPAHARVVFGDPIDLSDAWSQEPISKETIAAVTDRLMAAIRALQEREQKRRADESRLP
jgi:1-acyl-sn-glycerol-3-phosphate acyltransferase